MKKIKSGDVLVDNICNGFVKFVIFNPYLITIILVILVTFPLLYWKASIDTPGEWGFEQWFVISAIEAVIIGIIQFGMYMLIADTDTMWYDMMYKYDKNFIECSYSYRYNRKYTEYQKQYLEINSTSEEDYIEYINNLKKGRN